MSGDQARPGFTEGKEKGQSSRGTSPRPEATPRPQAPGPKSPQGADGLRDALTRLVWTMTADPGKPCAKCYLLLRAQSSPFGRTTAEIERVIQDTHEACFVGWRQREDLRSIINDLDSSGSVGEGLGRAIGDAVVEAMGRAVAGGSRP